MDEQTTSVLKVPFEKRAIPPNPTSTTSETTIPTILTALDSLPTISGKKNKCVLVNEDIKLFLEEDLNLERINRIHDLLWMCGRPLRARPLHRYKMMGFEILYTQQMDLHLLKFSNQLLLKPLPEWMLDHQFWVDNICKNRDFHESAWGFLVSYVWLLTTPLDLKLAHDNALIPPAITWHWWKAFVTDFYGKIDMEALDGVNKRYQFGDLRLGRINSIYRTRYMFTHFVRGYLYGYNRYEVFFQRNFSWILIVFVFFSLVLSAMQVGAGLPQLQDNDTFLSTSYGFVVFSIVACGAVLLAVSLIFVVIFFFNMVAAISHDKRMKRKRNKRVLGRMTEEKDS